MESRFGHDFAGVRVHTTTDAADAAQSVSARAFTVGGHVVFGAGQYAPQTEPGQRLLAHELAHTIQQGQSPPTNARSTVAAPLGRAAGPLLQREVGESSSGSDASDADETEMSREEEVEVSRTSPGRLAVLARPVRFSLYNFAVAEHRLKPEHQAAIREIRSLVGRMPSSTLRILIVGHASAPGSTGYNLRISHRRARSVRSSLRSVRGAPVSVAALPPAMLGFSGEAQPVADNDTVEGRSRNRRTEIWILPYRPMPPPGRDDPVPPPRPTDSWFCIEHPIICAAIGGVAALLIFCLRNPTSCLPSPPPPPPGRRRYDRRACVEWVLLPGGHYTALPTPVDPFVYLDQDFDMDVRFRQDDTGCECNLGEYRQKVRGYYERVDASGAVRTIRHRLADNRFLNRSHFQEDARDQLPNMPYGHRFFDDQTRLAPRPNQQEDRFSTGSGGDREHGCHYHGEDEPGFVRSIVNPGETIRFHLEYWGGPVDASLGCLPLLLWWSRWSVDGSHTEPTPPPPPPPPSRPTPPPTPTPPTPPPVGPTIGPLPPRPPSPYCHGGTIGCETAQHLDGHAAHGLITEDAIRQAIEIEFRTLDHHERAASPRRSHYGEEPVYRRARELGEEARRRVFEHIRQRRGLDLTPPPGSDYAR